MKVIFVTREGYELSGARVRCYHFAKELARHGIDARVFSFADDLGAKYGEKELEMSGLKKIGLNVRAFRSLIKESSDTVFILQRLNYHVLAPLLVKSIFKNSAMGKFNPYFWKVFVGIMFFWSKALLHQQTI